MKSLTLLFACSLLGLGVVSGQAITGSWNGVLEVQGMELRIVFHIEETDNSYSTTMDSPDQGAKGIPTDATTFTDGVLTIEASQLGMKYTATLSAEGKTLEGTFQQGPMELPLVLGREEIEKTGLPARPQDPTDFPYEQEEVKFANATAEGVTLAGTLTLPRDQEFAQLVVLVSGSGPQNRDEEVAAFNHRPFLVLSDYLTRQGIGVLRYDDRGVGESTGNQTTATTADFATDASAAVDYLASRADLAGAKIGILGHSEGGMIAPMVANTNKNVDFIGLLAGPGIPIDELMLLQSEKMATAGGTPAAITAINQAVLKQAYDYLKQERANDDKETVKEELIAIMRNGLNAFPEEVKAKMGDLDERAAKEAEGLLSPWFRYFITFNPNDELQQVKVPVLAINGELDLQVPAQENLAGIAAALEKGGNKMVEIVEMPGLNHLFQQATTGAVSEYGQIEETFQVAAMEVIAKWIKQQ